MLKIMLPEKKIHGRFDSHCGSVRSSMHDHTNSSPKGDRQHALIQQQVQSAEDEDKDEKKLRKSRLVRRFSVLKSTEQHHVADADDKTFYGVYGHLRKCLDYNYHVHYTKKRQWFHDAVVADSLFKDNDWSEVGPNTKIPTTSLWLILTVGIHGVYKHSVIHNLIASKKLPLTTFVRIDTGAYDCKDGLYSSVEHEICSRPHFSHCGQPTFASTYQNIRFISKLPRKWLTT